MISPGVFVFVFFYFNFVGCKGGGGGVKGQKIEQSKK